MDLWASCVLWLLSFKFQLLTKWISRSCFLEKLKTNHRSYSHENIQNTPILHGCIGLHSAIVSFFPFQGAKSRPRVSVMTCVVLGSCGGVRGVNSEERNLWLLLVSTDMRDAPAIQLLYKTQWHQVITKWCKSDFRTSCRRDECFAQVRKVSSKHVTGRPQQIRTLLHRRSVLCGYRQYTNCKIVTLSQVSIERIGFIFIYWKWICCLWSGVIPC